MLEKLRNSGIFDTMQLTEPLSEVYDENVIEGSWMMYGSCKPNHKPYELTHILQYNVDEEDEDDDDIVDIEIECEQYTPQYLTRILSMRNRSDSLVTLQSHKERIIADMETKVITSKNEKRMRILAHKQTDAEKTYAGILIAAAIATGFSVAHAASNVVAALETAHIAVDVADVIVIAKGIAARA